MDALVLNRKASTLCKKEGYELYVSKPNEVFTKEDIPSLIESLFFWVRIAVLNPQTELQIKINKLCYQRYIYCTKELKKIHNSPFLEYMLNQEDIITTEKID